MRTPVNSPAGPNIGRVRTTRNGTGRARPECFTDAVDQAAVNSRTVSSSTLGRRSTIWVRIPVRTRRCWPSELHARRSLDRRPARRKLGQRTSRSRPSRSRRASRRCVVAAASANAERRSESASKPNVRMVISLDVNGPKSAVRKMARIPKSVRASANTSVMPLSKPSSDSSVAAIRGPVGHFVRRRLSSSPTRRPITVGGSLEKRFVHENDGSYH
jgi:hypothetical protein